MFDLLLGILKGIIGKLVFYGAVLLLILWGWNSYKHKREAKAFIVSFNNVEGLSKGSAVYSQGVKVGKVIDIFPLGNSSEVGVKGLITDPSFPPIRGKVNAKIISDIEKGGGKVLEIKSMIEPLEAEYLPELGGNKEISKGNNPFTVKHALRLMLDFFQLTKDFGEQSLAALGSPQSQEYQEKLSNTVSNTVTSLEYGTLKSDVKNGIEDLNRDIKELERNPRKKQKVQRDVANKTQALVNTLGAVGGSLSDVYKQEAKKRD